MNIGSFLKLTLKPTDQTFAKSHESDDGDTSVWMNSEVMPGGIQETEADISLSKIDLTYFSEWLPKSFAADACVQNLVARRWEHVQYQIHSANEKGVKISCLTEEGKLFEPLVRIIHKVMNVSTSKGRLKITLKKRSTDEILVKKISRHAKTARPIKLLPQVASHSVRFFDFTLSNAYQAHYLEKLIDLSERLLHGMTEKQKEILILCIGYDREFFKAVLCALYPEYIEMIVADPSDAPGSLKIGFKAERPYLDNFMKVLSKLKKVSEASEEPQSIARFYGDELSASLQMSSEEAAMSLNYAAGLYSACICDLVRHELPGVPEQGDLDVWRKIWISIPSQPLMLQPYIREVQEFLFENFRSLIRRDVQNFKELCHSSNLKEFHERLEACDKGIATIRLKKHLGGMTKLAWMNDFFQQAESLPYRSIREAIQKLAALKFKVEGKSISPKRFKEDSLWKIPIDQVPRSYFPSDGIAPLVSVWINGIPLSLEEQRADASSSAPSLAYFTKLVRALAPEESVDDHMRLAAEISKGKEPQGEKGLHLALMLRAGTFSCYGIADKLLREAVLKKTSRTYQIKFLSPQENATCEFFVAKNGDFEVIRTGVYAIQRDRLEKGQFVVKWAVSCREGKWVANLSLPSVSLNFNSSFEEQEEIYRSLIL